MNKLYILLALVFLSCNQKQEKIYTNTATETFTGTDFQRIYKICMRMVKMGTDSAEYVQHGDSEIIMRHWAIGENGKEYFSRKVLLHAVPDGVKIEVSSDWKDKYAQDSNNGFIFIVKDDLKKVRSGELTL